MFALNQSQRSDCELTVVPQWGVIWREIPYKLAAARKLSMARSFPIDTIDPSLHRYTYHSFQLSECLCNKCAVSFAQPDWWQVSVFCPILVSRSAGTTRRVPIIITTKKTRRSVEAPRFHRPNAHDNGETETRKGRQVATLANLAKWQWESRRGHGPNQLAKCLN